MNDLELTVSRTIERPAPCCVRRARLSPGTLAKFMRPPSGGGDARVSNDPVKRWPLFDRDGRRGRQGDRCIPAPIWRSTRTATCPSPGNCHSPASRKRRHDRLRRGGPDRTEITVRQSTFKSEGARDGHLRGWTAILGNLERSWPAAAEKVGGTPLVQRKPRRRRRRG